MPGKNLKICLRFKSYGLHERVDKINKGVLETSIDTCID
jgi:hypothetical protein